MREYIYSAPSNTDMPICFEYAALTHPITPAHTTYPFMTREVLQTIQACSHASSFVSKHHIGNCIPRRSQGFAIVCVLYGYKATILQAYINSLYAACIFWIENSTEKRRIAGRRRQMQMMNQYQLCALVPEALWKSKGAAGMAIDVSWWCGSAGCG